MSFVMIGVEAHAWSLFSCFLIVDNNKSIIFWTRKMSGGSTMNLTHGYVSVRGNTVNTAVFLVQTSHMFLMRPPPCERFRQIWVDVNLNFIDRETFAVLRLFILSSWDSHGHAHLTWCGSAQAWLLDHNPHYWISDFIFIESAKCRTPIVTKTDSKPGVCNGGTGLRELCTGQSQPELKADLKALIYHFRQFILR